MRTVKVKALWALALLVPLSAYGCGQDGSPAPVSMVIPTATPASLSISTPTARSCDGNCDDQ